MAAFTIPSSDSPWRVLKGGISLVLGLLLLIGSGYYFWSVLVKQGETANSAIAREVSKQNTIRMHGQLQPLRAVILVNNVAGRVVQIHQRPGAKVSAGQVVVTLSNPELQSGLDDAQLALSAQQAEFQVFSAQQQQQKLLMENELKMARSDLKVVQAEKAANKALYNEHIVSALVFNRVQARLDKAKLLVAMLSQKLETFDKRRRSLQEVEHLKLKKFQKSLSTAERHNDDLIVRATMDGVLTELNPVIELGNKINTGENLGQVADPSNLYGEMLVSATDASAVELGKGVSLSLKGQKLTGKVSRISPNIVQHQLRFDVALTSELPPNARPYIEVLGQLKMGKAQPLIYVRRPGFVTRSGMKQLVYVKSHVRGDYEVRSIEIGNFYGEDMHVIKGLAAGERLLLSRPGE